MSTTVVKAPGTTSQKVKSKFKFRLLRSRHSEKVPDPNNPGKKIHISYQVERDPVTKIPIQPIFESEHELDKMFNVPGFTPKYERIGDATQTILNPMERVPGETISDYMRRLTDLQESIKATISEKLKEVDSLEDDDLTAYAEAEEFDITGATTPAQQRTAIKRAIRGA